MVFQATTSSIQSDTAIDSSFSAKSNTVLSRKQKFYRWARHHRRESQEAWGKLARRPIQTLMLAGLFGISLSFPFFFGWLIQSFQSTGMTQGIQEPTFSAYLNRRAPPSAIADLQKRLSIRPDVASVTLITPDEGLEELKAAVGLGEIFTSLSDNPLPSVLEVRWKAMQTSSIQAVPQARALSQFLQQQTIVDSVSFDTLWLERIRAVVRLGEKFTFILGVLFCLGAVLAIFNGIQLMIEQSRSDIQIAQWVGASFSYVRRPFLYVGSLLGLLGGALSSAILLGAFRYLNGGVNQVLVSYGFEFQMQGFPESWCFGLIVLSVGLGWLGAQIAVNRALR